MTAKQPSDIGDVRSVANGMSRNSSGAFDMEFKYILFPVDFSKPCEQIVPWVVEMVERLGSRLTLLNVWDSPCSWPGEVDPAF